MGLASDGADELTEVVEAFRAHSGVASKAALRLVAEVFGPTDWVTGPGDDTAAIVSDGGYLLAAGEAIWPPLIEADPFAAGTAAVVANVNDVAAMGGRALGLVNQVVAPEPLARLVMEGIRATADRYRVPVVGGHLTLREGPASVAASIFGRAEALLSARNVEAGQVLLAAFATDGSMRGDFHFFSSLDARSSRLHGDVEVLPRIAEAGVCVAAKDVSMAGFLGSLAMLLEASGSGATVDLSAIPLPRGISLPVWCSTFPSYGFVLCAPPEGAAACKSAFHDEGLACEVVGEVDASGHVRIRLGGREESLIDLREQGVTYLGGEPPAVFRPGPPVAG